LPTLVASIVITPVVTVVLPIVLEKSLPSAFLGSDHLLHGALELICCLWVIIAEGLELPFGLDPISKVLDYLPLGNIEDLVL